MKPFLRILTILPFTFLVACGENKNEKPLTTEEFQSMAYALEEHCYSKATVTNSQTSTRVLHSESDSYVNIQNRQAVFHFEAETKTWVKDDSDLNLTEVFMLQTVRDMNVAEIMDQRYDYTFYVNPIRVHMHRALGDDGMDGDATYDWQYDSYGYLISVHSYWVEENVPTEGDVRIIESGLRYVYE